MKNKLMKEQEIVEQMIEEKKKYKSTPYNKKYYSKAKEKGEVYNVGIRLWSGKDKKAIDYLKSLSNKRRFIIEAIYEKMNK